MPQGSTSKNFRYIKRGVRMNINIYDYDNKRKIDFKNNAKGIRDFILLLNKMFKENGIRIYIDFSYKNDN